MTYHQLDYVFPFVVFGYGLLMTLILNSQFFLELAEAKLPPQLYSQFTSHRLLGVVCLVVGGLWSVQNLWV